MSMCARAPLFFVGQMEAPLPPTLQRASASATQSSLVAARAFRVGSDPADKGVGLLPGADALVRPPEGLRGWLHKMQEREVNVLLWGGSGSRWEPRFFVLQGGSLQYYRGTVGG
jgi:hypothetical protein